MSQKKNKCSDNELEYRAWALSKRTNISIEKATKKIAREEDELMVLRKKYKKGSGGQSKSKKNNKPTGIYGSDMKLTKSVQGGVPGLGKRK